MILEKLQMRDFRCYTGLADIDFARGDDRNTTVILGTNGAGKTSILQALTFALYGTAALDLDPQSPLIANNALKGASADRPARSSVTLHFRHDNTPYQLTRVVRGYLDGPQVRYLSRPDDLRLTFKTIDGNTERDEFPQQSIERMLPSPIRTFFLFDGDRIADFTKPGRERDEKIRRAVNDVLHIEALTRASDRTAKIASEKLRRIESSGAPQINKLKIEIEQQESIVQQRHETARQLQHDITTTGARISQIDGELISFSEVAKLAGQRRDLEKRQEMFIERGRQLRDKLARSTVAAGPALVRGSVQNSIELLEKHKSEHEIPARIADYFLRDMMDRGSCICGRPVLHGTPERKELERLLQSLVPNSIQDKATELLNKLRPLESGMNERVRDVIDVMKAIQANDTEIARLDKELERIGGEIDASAYDRSIELNKERRAAGIRLMELKDAADSAEREATKAVQVKRLLEERLNSEMRKRSEFEELRKEWVIARDCSDALQQARTILEERLRASLGAEATDILRKLVSDAKAYFFSEVKVDSNFLLRVLDRDGRDVRAQLSMGETQVSSLAFMLAMTRLGGQAAPLVVDTPLARLDVSVRAHTAHWLPKLTTQLVLLATDAELQSDVEEQLAPALGKRLRLIPSPDGTRIEGTDNGEN